MKRSLLIAILAVGALLGFESEALELPPQFSEGMVLQRGAANRIWGQRTPGMNKEVWVEFVAGLDAKPVLRSDSNTKNATWEVELSVGDGKGKTRGPAQISIWEGTRKEAATASRTVLRNILVGDVWIVALPEREGFSYQPGALPDARALVISSVTDLDQTTAPGQFRWADLQNWPKFPAMANQIATSLRKDDPNTPIGLIVTTTAQWPGSLQLTRWESFARSGPNFLKEAAHGAVIDIRNQKQSDEEISIALKHMGKVTNSAAIYPYSQLEPALRVRKYPKAVEALEWEYKGAIAPAPK